MPLAATLSQLESAQLVRRLFGEEAEYAFRHALMQDAAHGSLLNSQRRELHRLVARVFEAQPEFCPDESGATLALHYAEAGDDAKVLAYSIRAGDAAAQKYANTEAIAHYTRAIDAATRCGATREQILHLYTMRGRLFELSGDFAGAMTGYEDLAKLAATHDETEFEVASLLARATVLGIPSPMMNPLQAKVLGEQALALAQANALREWEAKALWALNLAYRFTDNDFEQSARLGERSLHIARELGMRELEALNVQDLAPTYWGLGDIERGRTSNANATALWRELGNVAMQAVSMSDYVLFARAAGEWDAALTANDEVLRTSELSGNQWAKMGALVAKTWILKERGDVRSAIALIGEAISISAQAGVAFGPLMARETLAEILSDMGDLQNAARAIREFQFELPDNPPTNHPITKFIFAGMAKLRLLEGDEARANSLWQRAFDAFDRRNLYAVIVPVFDGLGLVLAHARGDSAAILAHTDTLLNERWRVALRGELPRTLWFRALALHMQSRTDEALAALHEARALAEPMQWRQLLWQVYGKLAEIGAQRGDIDEATVWQAHARAVIGYIADHAPDDLRANFLARSEVRAIMDASLPIERSR